MPTTFKPTDVPELSGRVFFITGGRPLIRSIHRHLLTSPGTAGLGAGTISLLAKRNPAHIFFSGRNSKNANELIAKINKESPGVPLTFIQCDLADMSSVKQATNELLSRTDRLDVFYANAGIMASPPGTTKDGYEIQFGTNHMGHALMIRLLLPLLQRTAEQPNSDVRIINMSSVAYKQAPSSGIDLSTVKSTQEKLGGAFPGPTWARYGQSKLANLLYARELAKRYPQIMTVSIHPGFIKSDLWASTSFGMTQFFRVFVPLTEGWTSIEEGPYNQTWAGTTTRENLESGTYYAPIGKKGKLETAASRDDALASKLWDWTQKELEQWS